MSALIHAGLSDRGRVRKQNEDTWAADPELGLFLVSDGMGGEAEGALASRIVAKTLPTLVRQRMGSLTDLTAAHAAEKLGQLLAELSDQVYKEAHGRPGLRGMGATVVLALIRGSAALIGHMGDSRAYLLRQGKLQPITHDHSLVQLLLDTGDITPEEAKVHPTRGQITRYVGMAGEALPEVRLAAVEPGDRLLLCSDGLTGMLTDEKLAPILSAGLTPEGTCQRLVAAANEAGGKDNITAVVVDI